MAQVKANQKILHRRVSPVSFFALPVLGLPGRKHLIPYSIQTLKRLKPEFFRQDLMTLFDLLRQNKIKPLIAQRVPLASARYAQETLEHGGVVGKIVLVCNNPPAESPRINN